MKLEAGRTRGIPVGMGGPADQKLAELIGSNVPGTTVVLFTQSHCRYCKCVHDLLGPDGLALGPDNYFVHNLPHSTDSVGPENVDSDVEGAELRMALARAVGNTSVPQLFVGGELIGGCDY